MDYNTEEYYIYLEAQELRQRARKLQSKADKMSYSRKKREAEEKEKNGLLRDRAAFALNIEALRDDITKTIPVAYGAHDFSTQIRWNSSNPDIAQFVIYFERK